MQSRDEFKVKRRRLLEDKDGKKSDIDVDIVNDYYYLTLDRSDRKIVPIRYFFGTPSAYSPFSVRGDSTRIQDYARKNLSHLFDPITVKQLAILGNGRPLEQVLWEAFSEFLSIEHMTFTLLHNWADAQIWNGKEIKNKNRNKKETWAEEISQVEDKVEKEYRRLYPRMDAFQERMELAKDKFRTILSLCYTDDSNSNSNKERLLQHIVTNLSRLSNVYDIDNRSRSMPSPDYAVILLGREFDYLGHVYARKPWQGGCMMIGIRTGLDYSFARLCQGRGGTFVKPMLEAVARWCRSLEGDHLEPYEPLSNMAKILEKMGFSKEGYSYSHALYSNKDRLEPYSFHESVDPLRYVL